MTITFCGKEYSIKNHSYINKESPIMFKIKGDYIEFKVRDNQQKISFDAYFKDAYKNPQEAIDSNQEYFIKNLIIFTKQLKNEIDAFEKRYNSINKEFDKIFILQ